MGIKISGATRVHNFAFYLLLILLGGGFLLSGYMEITKHAATYPKTLEMGYPPYFIRLLGIAKLAGVAALWQARYKWLREWAFAGFTFDVVFAFCSGYAIGSYADCVKSFIVFVLLAVAYRMHSHAKE